MAKPSRLTSTPRRNTAPEPGLIAEQIPRHVAIIMDGNGRWAQKKGLPRIMGHRQGIHSVRSVVEESCRLGIQQLTLYCLSQENWKRPASELRFLMRLLRKFLVAERPRLQEQNVRLVMIGRRQGLPPEVLEDLDHTVDLTRGNSGLTLCLAINYGARDEIIEAAKAFARDVQQGILPCESLDESLFSSYLTTSGMPDPDLLIRTAGELRVSNYLLWQISYTELWITEVLWPDFRPEHLHAAILSYALRQRKFGGLPQPRSPS